MGNEASEYGVDVLLGPALNTHRNPLGGRNFEYYSEDPLVSGRMAAAMVKGVQSQGVGTSPKHFAANDHEWNRNVIDVKASQRALREIYLRGLRDRRRGRRSPWTVMSSYNKLNGTYTSESPALLTGVLRDDWGFEGLVMTDWFGGRDAVAQMNAGNDLLMPGTARQKKALLAALDSGALQEDVLDRNVARILETHPAASRPSRRTPRSDKPDLAAHAQVGRDAAAQGMVLLRNEGGAAAPRRRRRRSPSSATRSYAMITGGTGSGDVNEAYTISLVEGLKAAGFARRRAPSPTAYAAYIAEQKKKQPAPARPFHAEAAPPREGGRPPTRSPAPRGQADLALFTIGRNSGEFRDREREGDFELTAVEKALIQDVADGLPRAEEEARRRPQHRRRHRDRELARHARRHPARLAAGPGVGPRDRRRARPARTPPSGKLATTFPIRWEDVPSSANFPGKTLVGPDPNAQQGPFRGRPRGRGDYDDDVFVGYRHYATKGVKTAYPFGFGLSYTTFDYSGLKLSGAEFGEG